MPRYIESDDRDQSTLFPASLEEYITEDNPVRVIDVFIEELNLVELGFDSAVPADTGRPSYHPATLLKLYLYGYLNRIQSSRRLERETQRNVELMWLLGRLSPDFKTIADFRKDNGVAITRVGREFVLLCRHLGLFSQAIVAIDGSKFKAVNNRDRNFTEHKLKARIEQVEENITRYLVELDRADREPSLVPEARVTHLKEKVRAAKKHLQKFRELGHQLKQAPDRQISLTDPDARSMATSGRGTGMVGYNVQTAVDTRHHLIVAHEVTNLGHDRTMLREMATRAREVIGEEKKTTVIADRGYFSGEQVRACEQDGIATLVPKPQTSGNKAGGLFDRKDFRYNARRDEYTCPAGERAIYRFSRIENGLLLHRYWPSACPRCKLKKRCTIGDYRRISRWEHEAVLERMQRRLDRTPDAMAIRRATVEHPFATLKSWMGATHFLTRTLPKVRTEMSLNVLAYNMKRVINILGVQAMMQAIQA